MTQPSATSGPVATRGSVGSFALWWGLFAAMVLVGRFSAADASSVGLISPAAGAGLLWLMAQSSSWSAVTCLATMALTRAVLSAATGAAVGVTVAVVLGGLVQTALMVWLLRRWCPGLLGAGGSRSVHEPGVLARGSAAVLIATGVGAAVGAAVVVGLDAPVQGRVLLDWWTRNLTGVFFVGAAGHLAWEWARDARRRDRWVPMSRSRAVEVAALLVTSGIVYSAVFVGSSLPLAFLPLTLSVWTAGRFSTFVAVLHATAFAVLVMAATVVGRGPFGAVDTAETQALVTQAYLLTLLLTVLALATGRDERQQLVHELRVAQQETAERAELLDAMTEAMSEGLVVVDTSGVLLRTNTAARTLLTSSATGYQDSASAYRVLRPDGSEIPPEAHPSARALREGTVPAHDVVLQRMDGTERVLSVTASALRGGAEKGGPQAAMVVYRDVTDDRNLSNRLTEFAEVVAHDLRSPLTVMRGWLDVALGGLSSGGAPAADVTRAPPLVRRAVERALVSAERMEELIADLLVQATAAGGRMEPVPCALDGDDGLVAEIAEEMGASGLISVGVIPPVLVDMDMVRQLFSNLMGNSLKYVATGTTPQVLVTGSDVDARVRIEMTDNGIGVPVLQQEAIFERFHRAHADDATYAGTGLGLAICRTIVQRHGGDISCLPATEADAAGSSGTTFVFDLPAA